MKFEEIKFNEKMKKTLRDMKYENATEVQEQSIPVLISGENLICKSYTGSGKTLAFGIGVSERLLMGKSNGVLIIGPTRELVVQVKEELHKLNRHTGLKVQVVYGGHGMGYEVQSIKKGLDILVATPGRLLDHIRQGTIRKDLFDTIVLDEADRMLDMGFIEDIKLVLDFIKPKNTHLFSATLDGSVAKLIQKYIPTFKEINIKTEIIGTNIIEKNIDVRPQDKFLYLLEVVKKSEGKRILVFVSTKREAENVERKLNKSGFYSASIHGDKSQRYREIALKDFKAGKVQILIATDVAARGLQIDNVEFVVNYDTARDKDTHKHRIGRTGRMGAKGIAVNFLTDDDKYRQERRQGRRPVRSQHSIDNKDVNVWDLANKSRGRFSRDNSRGRGPRRSFDKPRFGDKTKSESRDRFSRTRDISDFGSKDSPRQDNRRNKLENTNREYHFREKDASNRRNDRKSFGDDLKNETGNRKPNFSSEKKHDFKDHRVGPFVPKSFRRDKDYMSGRPEYKQDKSQNKFGDKPKRDFNKSDKRSFDKPNRFKSKDSGPKDFKGKKKFKK